MADAPHRIKVRVLVVLASFLAFLAIFTGWVDRQVLDTDEWVDTSGRLIEDEEISDAVAIYSVDQLYANVDVARSLKKRLPDDLQPVSGPVSAGIREFATRAAQQALQSPRVQGNAKLDRLERLGQLKEKGVLTAAELRAGKKRILEDAAIEEEAPIAPAKRRRG